MPIYEYECLNCGNQMEIWQKFSDPEVKECSKCKGKVKKLISQSAFHLKGSGWYVTDYARNTGGKQQQTTDVPSGEQASAKSGGEEKKSEPNGKEVSQASGKAESSSKKDSSRE